jgi:hypothetical protein
VELFFGLFGEPEMIGFFCDKIRLDPANIIFLCRLIRKIASEVMCRSFGWRPRDRRISG